MASIINDRFILILALYCYCGDNGLAIPTSFKTLLKQRMQKFSGWKKLETNDK